MGTWSTSVEANDTFGDIVSSFDQHLKKSQSVQSTTDYVLSSYAEYFEDDDEFESAYFAIADRQWTYGEVDDTILRKITEKDFGLSNWLDAEADQLMQRQKALAAFLARVTEPNEKRKRLPRIIRRKPKFLPGNCLSFQNPDGRYSAGLVTAINDSDPEYGRDLVVLMDYLSSQPPETRDYLARKWLHTPSGDLMCYWYGHSGFRKVSAKLSVVDTIEVLETDPINSNAHADWQGFGPFVVRAKGN